MEADSDIQRAVIDELAWEPGLNGIQIGVSVKRGVVTLSGIVRTLAEKLAAEAAAHRVKGVKAVASDVEVRLDRDGSIPDSRIAENIIQAFRWHSGVPADRLLVRVEGGRVRLEGEVEWIFQKTAAESAITNLAGIRHIDNKITVKPLVNADDVKRKIREALQRNANLEASNIRIEASGSKVTLAGSARSWKEREEVARTAASAPGVSEVDDQLTVIS